MVKRKLDGVEEGASVDQKICKSNATVRNLWKTWRLVPSGTRSYGRLAGRPAGWQNLVETWNFKSLLQIETLDFPLCLAEVLHCFSNLDAFIALFPCKHFYKVVL